MKKYIVCLLFICLFVSQTACAKKDEIIIFAASSLTESITAIGDKFMENNTDIQIIYNFDSSGTLKTQIKEGAECDIFISANQKHMNDIDEYIVPLSKLNMLKNTVVLVVPKNNPKAIKSFDDLVHKIINEDMLLSMGNSDVPAGMYAIKLLRYLGLDERELANNGKISYASNVKEVTVQVLENVVDAGIVYQTDAHASGLEVVDIATEQMCGEAVYPLAILKDTHNHTIAHQFIEYILSEQSKKVFESAGFSVIE